jgi:predicted transcriptional regulator
MKAREIMTGSPCCATVNDSMQDVARMMRDNDCGSIPVLEAGCIVGIVTDRDCAGWRRVADPDRGSAT